MWFSSAWPLLPSTVINFPSVRNALRKPAKRLWQSLRIWRFCLRSLGSTWLHLLLIHWLVLDYNKLTQYPSQRVSGNPHYLHFRRSFLLRLLRTSILTSPLCWSAPPSSPSSSCAHWKQVSNLPSYLYMYFLFRIPRSTRHLFFVTATPKWRRLSTCGPIRTKTTSTSQQRDDENLGDSASEHTPPLPHPSALNADSWRTNCDKNCTVS